MSRVSWPLLLATVLLASCKFVAGQDTADVRAKSPRILRSFYRPRGGGEDHGFDFGYETENGIKQSTVGEMRRVGDADVVVMRGSYEYVGREGRTYRVEWYADETGFHPTPAEHFPRQVDIPYQAQRKAVQEQLRFAERQRSSQSSKPPPRLQTGFIPVKFEEDEPSDPLLSRPHFVIKRKRRRKPLSRGIPKQLN